MSISLLDVNVLIALLDPAHMDHVAAHDWFAGGRKAGWASCPTTINGCVRVLSNPRYPTVDATPAEVAERLRVLCGQPEHTHWREDASLLDAQLFRAEYIAGPSQITDVHLLGLAVRNHGRLVTFDRSIPLKAVTGADARHLMVLGRVRTH